MRVVALLALVLLGGAGGTSLAAQDLERVEELMAVGEGERARVLLAGWREAGPPAAQLPRGIWLEGRLASDPEVAALHYGRLAIEFPGSAFADDALLRLAMLAEARGDWREARERLGTLLRDYPGSPLRLEAGERLRRTPASRTPSSVVGAGESTEVDSPVPPWEARAAIEEALRQDLALREAQRDSVAADVEFEAAELEFAATEIGQEEVAAVAEAAVVEESLSLPGDPVQTVAGDTVQGGSGDTAQAAGGLPPASGRYTVQLGAFSTRERAEALAQQVRHAGLAPRVVQVPGSALFRVRVGYFQSAAEGDDERRRISALGFDAVVSTDGNEETQEP